jgi:hypothetical protein
MKPIKHKAKRVFSYILILLSIGILSNYLVRTTKISSFPFFDDVTLFSYFGVLIGFAITIYTFGLSMVSEIKIKIDKHLKFDKDQKKVMYLKLVSGFSEIKEDIWIIFYSLIIILSFSLSKNIPNPFCWDVKPLMLPETANLTLFTTTTIAMWDIMKTLFNLSEINLELNKED